MKIEFLAVLQGRKCISFDDDHSAEIKLTMDGSQVASVVHCLSLKGKTFKVSIDTKDAK